jgi:hypothetical protein
LHLEFKNEDALQTYIKDITNAQYRQVRGRETLKNGDEISTLICRRSAESKHHNESQTQRIIRSHGSVKLHENCLSRFRIVIHAHNGAVSATYFRLHTGQDPATDHHNVFRLGNAVLKTIDTMILDGIPAVRIMKDLNAALRDRHCRDAAFQVKSTD